MTHTIKVYVRERNLLKDVGEDDFIYQVYEKVEAWPTTTWDPFRVGTELVIEHRLRVMKWYAQWLGLDDVRQLTKRGAEEVILQRMRKPALKKRRRVEA